MSGRGTLQGTTGRTHDVGDDEKLYYPGHVVCVEVGEEEEELAMEVAERGSRSTTSGRREFVAGGLVKQVSSLGDDN